MAILNPISLYPPYDRLKAIDSFNEYPELDAFFIKNDLWMLKHWRWGQAFLSYIGRNKSEHTYTRFRNEIERFLLWAFLVKKGPIDNMRKGDLLEYADFCWRPPVSWICLANHEKFILQNGAFGGFPPFRRSGAAPRGGAVPQPGAHGAVP